jgi:DNA-binding response OmpR family regulator
VPTVLIVEDDKDTSLLVAMNLKKRGYEIVEAQTAQDGLDLLKRHGPQLLVLDVKLRGSSGWDLLEAIDRDHTLTKLPVITMTASTFEKLDAYPYPNIVGRLTKPFEVTDLLRLVSSSIRG